MRLSKLFFLPFLVLISFYACKTEELKPAVYDNYLPLAVGNYWIYQTFSIKGDGTEIPLNRFDSIFIKNDTIIDGEKYFAFYHKLSRNSIYPGGEKTNIPELLRDSAGFLIEPAKKDYKKYLAPLSFVDTLSFDTTYLDYKKKQTIIAVAKPKMEQGISRVQVPAGNFEVITRDEFCDWYIYKSEHDPNSFEKIIQNNQPILFSKDIGLIKRTYFYYPYDVKSEAGTKNEIQLVRYHVNRE